MKMEDYTFTISWFLRKGLMHMAESDYVRNFEIGVVSLVWLKVIILVNQF